MSAIEIWAPRAKTVEILVGDRRIAATRDDRGVWRAPAPGHGIDYALSVDGGAPRPDPRSRWQPHGVHGASRWYEPAPARTDFRAPPLGSGLIYELHVGTFTPEGTFDAAIGRLDHLRALGVTHVEIMPVAAFPGARGWGYDGVDLFATHDAYGGPAGLQRLVDACHAHGLAAILDVVYNHLGPDGDYLRDLAPYFTEREHTPWGAAIDFTEPEARRFFLDNVRWWLRDLRFDGLRLDATHAIFDASEPHILAELADVRDEIAREQDRPLVLIAEHEHNDPRLTEPRPRGHGLDAFWYDDFHHAVHAALTGERRGYYAPFGSLHDIATALLGHTETNTRGARPLGPPDGRHCVACIQNHDQVGNRALGERLGHLVSPGRLRLAAALLFTSPFVPLLFQGEEWNASRPFLYFTDHTSEDLARAVREGRRAEHAAFVDDPDRIPDPQAPSTMQRSVLDWSEPTRAPHRDVLAWYTALSELRRSIPELLDGARDRVEVHTDDDTIVVRRGRVTVAGSIATSPRTVPAPRGTVRLAFPDRPRRDGDAWVLAPDACVVSVDD
jgi:maltooligosyltrehalose trehalohydrolase